MPFHMWLFITESIFYNNSLCKESSCHFELLFANETEEIVVDHIGWTFMIWAIVVSLGLERFKNIISQLQIKQRFNNNSIISRFLWGIDLGKKTVIWREEEVELKSHIAQNKTVKVILILKLLLLLWFK